MSDGAENRFLKGMMGANVPHFVTADEMREQIAAHKWPFYVYALCSKDGAGFYIGKGQGGRIFQHAAEAAQGVKSNKCDVIRLLGDDLRYALIASCADEKYALAIETGLIQLYWNRLTNACHGMSFELIDKRPEPTELETQIALLAEIGAALKREKEKTDALMRALLRSRKVANEQ